MDGGEGWGGRGKLCWRPDEDGGKKATLGRLGGDAGRAGAQGEGRKKPRPCVRKDRQGLFGGGGVVEEEEQQQQQQQQRRLLSSAFPFSLGREVRMGWMLCSLLSPLRGSAQLYG